MFERVFQWGLRNGSRVLFVAAAAILLIAVWQVFNGLLAGNSTYWSGLAYLFGALSSASFPLFCAVVIERIDLWLQRGSRCRQRGPRVVMVGAVGQSSAARIVADLFSDDRGDLHRLDRCYQRFLAWAAMAGKPAALRVTDTRSARSLARDRQALFGLIRNFSPVARLL